MEERLFERWASMDSRLRGNDGEGLTGEGEAVQSAVSMDARRR